MHCVLITVHTDFHGNKREFWLGFEKENNRWRWFILKKPYCMVFFISYHICYCCPPTLWFTFLIISSCLRFIFYPSVCKNYCEWPTTKIWLFSHSTSVSKRLDHSYIIWRIHDNNTLVNVVKRKRSVHFSLYFIIMKFVSKSHRNDKYNILELYHIYLVPILFHYKHKKNCHFIVWTVCFTKYN